MNLQFKHRFLFSPDASAVIDAPAAASPLPDNPYLVDAAAGNEFTETPGAAREEDDGAASLETLNPAKPEIPDPSLEPEARRETKRELTAKLEEATARAKALEDSGQELTQKFTTAEKEAEELRKALKERDDDYVSKVVPEYNPNLDPDLQSIGREIGSRLQNTVPFLNSPLAQSTLTGQLPKILEGFAHHLANGDIRPFRALLEKRLFTPEQIENNPEECQADIKEVMTLCREMLPNHVKYQETLAKNQESWDVKREASFSEKQKAVDAVFDGIGAWTEDQIKENPTHPQALISGLMKANPKVAIEIKELAAAHKELATGPKPLPRNPTPQQIAAHRSQQKRFQEVSERAAENAFYMQVLPGLAAHLYDANQKLTKRLGGAANANRPDAAPGASGGRKGGEFDIPEIPAGQTAEGIKNPYL